MAAAPAVESVQCFGRKKTAVAVTYCKRGRGLIKINGCPIELIEPEILRYKAYEPILLLGRHRFAALHVCNYDENIVVFMYNDIAYDEENPRQGIIINSPHGDDVYEGVPKDYTGDDVTVNNFFAAILGDKTALTVGSGKVVDSGPTTIFSYITLIMGVLGSLVRTFETHCGSISQYGMKHMRSVANICNAGIRKDQMAEASSQACVSIPSGPWSSLHKGFSA